MFASARLPRTLRAPWRPLARAGVVAGFVILGALPAHAEEPTVRVIDRAVRVTAAGERFPTDPAPSVVSLPDEWAATRSRSEGQAWYRIGLDVPAGTGPDQLLALYIERACSHVEVHLNGHRIHGGLLAGERVPRECAQAQLITLPTAWLQARANVVDLKLHGQPVQRVASRQRAGGLSALEIGPLATLAARQAWHQFWNVGAIQALSIALAVLGGAVMLLDSWNRRSTHLRPFGWLALGWAALSSRHWLADFGLDNSIVEFLAASAAAPIAAAAMLFLLRYAGRRWRPIERMLWPQTLLMPLTLLLAGPSRLFLASTLWNAVLGLELLAVMGQYLWLTRRQPRRDYVPMAVGLLTAALLLLFEFALQHGALEQPPVDVTQLVLTMLLIGVGARLLHAFAKSLQAAEMGRRALETRALEIAAEAERNFTQMADARVEQVTAQERKRIAADLHDDLGAKLLTIVHTSDSERISTLARDALEEMRLSVRGLTGKPMQLADALADWRAETVARLGQANIEIDWRSPAEEVEQTLPARSFVQTTRILRESVSNIIKHSGATHCKVRCAMQEREFGLVIQDNGRGIPMELDGKLDRGHGMTSMKHRAKQMQGQCLVESAPGYGTVIRLTLPL